MGRLTDYRAWVLRHWERGGWQQVVDRLTTKKGLADIERLIKDGCLERDPDYPELLRIAPAGRAALKEQTPC